MTLQKFDESDTSCKALPPGIKLTQTQGIIVDSFTQGPQVILLINLFYYILYKFEFPFIEQYKVDKDEWPWKQEGDDGKWRKRMIKALC